MAIENISDEIRDYIKNTLLQGSYDTIENHTPLITGGILDSISTLQMVDFLEKKFKIEFQPHEVDRENLDNIDTIARFVESKI